MTLPLVSVIIPTFNRSNALRYAIRSAIGQRFQNHEVLVIGDACTDDSEQVVAEAGDLRLRWYNLERRCGRQYGPVNFAFGLAQGRYIAYLGHDDLWLPNHLEHLVAAGGVGGGSGLQRHRAHLGARQHRDLGDRYQCRWET